MPENPDPNPASPPLPTTWERSRATRLDPNPEAMLICDGLFGICSPGLGKCEIGFLSLPDSTDPELNKHKPEIVVISVEKNRPETLFHLQWQRKAPPFNRIRLRLVNGSGPASFFLEDGMGSGRDFREMIDLEHELNNGNPAQIRLGAFSPILEVAHGVFHTLLLTPQTYTAHEINGSDKKSLGHLAYITAANLHCNPENGSVVLELRDELSQSWVKLGEWSVKGRKIFVVANNNCLDANGRKCEDASFKAGKSADPKTDFHLYFDAILGSPKRYDIICDQSPTLPQFGALLPEIQSALAEAGLIRGVIKSTNPTPCGGSGFGASGSL